MSDRAAGSACLVTVHGHGSTLHQWLSCDVDFKGMTVHPSIVEMWNAFTQHSAVSSELERSISSWHFCDNQYDADECAQLVVPGKKRATAPSLWGFLHDEAPLPAVGELHVVTDWSGVARCITRTTEIEIIPFDKISEHYAARKAKETAH